MNTTIASFLRHLSPADFAALGMQDMAYVKETDINGVRAYAVHAADGSQLTVMDNREAAFAACIQNDLDPVSAH